MIRKYGEGIYKIIHDPKGWCVARLESAGHWHRVSNLYTFRGWAQAFARRRKLNVINYNGAYA